MLIRNAYFDAVRKSGGKPVPIHTDHSGHCIINDSYHVDGIIFSGGGDINPLRYGKVSRPNLVDIDDERDSMELSLFHLVLEMKIPFLGICRGCQLINVAQGGSLYLDIKDENPSLQEHNWAPSRTYLAHPIRVHQGSILNDFGYKTGQYVNSIHHQGIHQIGNELSVIATAEDGLTEGLQLTGHPFGLAVQWHPEWLMNHDTSMVLFSALVNASIYYHYD